MEHHQLLGYLIIVCKQPNFSCYLQFKQSLHMLKPLFFNQHQLQQSLLYFDEVSEHHLSCELHLCLPE